MKKSTAEWVQKLTDKPSTFDLKKQKETFLQGQRDFGDVTVSCSKTIDKGKGIVSIPLQSDPYACEDQQLLNSIHHEENKTIGLVKSFLQSYLKLLRDERALCEMQSLIDKCEQLAS